MGLMLEVFDGGLDEAPSGPEQSPLYKMGFDAGYLAAQADNNAQQTALTQELVQAIADINFSYIDASAHVLEQLTDLFQTVLGKVLPAASMLSLREVLMEAITQSLKEGAQHPLTLSVSPQDIESFALCLQNQVFQGVVFECDNDLPTGAVVLKSGQHETSFNVEAALQDISQAFDMGQDMMKNKERL